MKINLRSTKDFSNRHIGPDAEAIQQMLDAVGVSSLDELIDQTLPGVIRINKELDLPKAQSEYHYLQRLQRIAAKNRVYRSYIGMGYYNTITPAPIRRNVFENPGWYTQYTPYQAEISQGRLEALLNFQTMVSDLTGLPIANASLLDEGTAAAEAMAMFFSQKNKRDITHHKIFVSDKCFPQTIDVLQSRALPLGIEVEVGKYSEMDMEDDYFAVLLQYPDMEGNIIDYSEFIAKAREKGIYTILAADILGLALMKSPGEMGADCAIGTTQRFGVPMGYGGPHAAYFATRDEFKRVIPGRIIGLSVDRHGNPALRMALQTREQHIRREKATSNICTAQALLAIMAGMYAVYHGPEGLKNIAMRIHALSRILAMELDSYGYNRITDLSFDTFTVDLGDNSDMLLTIHGMCQEREINLGYRENRYITIAMDETTQIEDVKELMQIFAAAANEDYEEKYFGDLLEEMDLSFRDEVVRETEYLTHPVFNTYHSETQIMRYIKGLERKDLSLAHSMIPLGSCTMKLNAVTELEPVSWPSFANMHPFAPVDQAQGYMQIIDELESYLSEITGFDATSLQPNSGAQGEFAGLRVIRAYQENNGEGHRNIVLIPASAHGTNPASAVMAGGKVVVVACDDYGNIDLNDLKAKAEEHKDNLSALMVTYPSTHGVFEHHIMEICKIIHDNGGQVYMDGANMNAQVGLTSPGFIGADVCHLNLHKTFAIPHGGGGPGMGPICVKEHLQPFLPGNPQVQTGGDNGIHAISAAPWGSASILLISYAYIRLLGTKGVTKSTKMAILNANYIKSRLQNHYDILYVGKENGRVAHELIIDMRPYKHTVNIEVEDIAKRLMDYGFHAPTVSFPVAGTLMIEPTESEDKFEIDRFCDAMIQIREEIAMIEREEADQHNNVLKNAPHTVNELTADEWNHPYTREKAAWPLPYVRDKKFWPSVARVNNSVGDRNLICTCPPLESYMEEGQPAEV